MNHIIIEKLLDLHEIIETPIHVTKPNQQTFDNMWAITSTEDLLQTIQLDDLKKFITQLLENRHFQLLQINQSLQATFYLWFDEQALQLRFNILIGIHDTLPFSCKLVIIDSPDVILENFLTTARQVATEGDVIEYLNPLEDHDNDEDENSYTLNVYVKVLQNNQI